VFGYVSKAEPEPAIDVKTLHTKIGELALENYFFVRRARKSGCAAERKKDDRSCPEAERQPSSDHAGKQQRQRLLSAAPGVGGRSEADAPYPLLGSRLLANDGRGQATHRVPLRRQLEVAGTSRAGRVQSGSVAGSVMNFVYLDWPMRVSGTVTH
jgi:hypothetical protein